MGSKKGLKVLEEKGEESIETELQQNHDMEGFTPKHWHQLTKEERRRDRKVKGRGCADRRPQQLYISKIKTSSQMAALAAIILTCMINTLKKRDDATVDIPGALLQTKMRKRRKKMFTIFSMEEWPDYWQKLRRKLTKSMPAKNAVRHTYISVWTLPSMGLLKPRC